MGPELVLVLGLVLRVLGAAACEHYLRYFETTVSNPSPGLPKFMVVLYVDGNLISRYDSETGRTVPGSDWMAANMDQRYWDIEAQMSKDTLQLHNLLTLRDRYNESGRAQTLQEMYGCDLLEDGGTKGYYRIAYDRKDVITLDMNTMTFTVVDMATQKTKRMWEEDGAVAEQCKHYLENTCIKALRKFVIYGRAVLERKEPPTVRVSGKEADGILTLSCRAYGFYPRRIAVSWLKDGEVRDQETERGSVAPNSDGTFYTWASIEARPEERSKYRCRVEHASLPEPGLYAWEPESIPLAVVLALAVAILAAVAIVAGFLLWKRRSGKKMMMMKGYNAAPRTDGAPAAQP